MLPGGGVPRFLRENACPDLAKMFDSPRRGRDHRLSDYPSRAVKAGRE